jgi:FkbM family methyltransferase
VKKKLLRSLLPKRLKPHTIRRGPNRGRVIVTSWHDYPGAILGYTEANLLTWLARNVGQGETWLDIGAHYGYTAIALADCVGPTGRVFAFEPMVGTAGCLSAARSLNRLTWLTVVPLGLGADPGLRTQTVATVRGMADRTMPDGSTDQICVACFDEIWPSLSGHVPTIHGIKIDVQGAEHDVILGMRDHLANSMPTLVVELHSGVDRTKIVDLLQTLGYRSAGMPVSGGPPGPPYLDDHSYVFVGR